MNDDEEAHALTEFLSERLPQLGLDADTYAPYLLPLLTENNKEDQDEEEWNCVLELLQASSETHSDDEAAWTALRQDIEAAWQGHLQRVAATERDAAAARQAELQAQLEQEKQEMQQALAEAEQQKAAATITSVSSKNDAAKQALLSRYAFENDQDDHNNANGAAAAEAPVSNKEVAAQALVEQARALRGQQVQTKKDEQQKTKQQKVAKAQLKEERRKRATKGERKR